MTTLLMALLCNAVISSALAQDKSFNALNDQLIRLVEQSRFEEALPVAENLLKVAEATFGPNDYRTGYVLSFLAPLSDLQGKRAEAKAMYERGLAIETANLGHEPREPNVLREVDGLVFLCRWQSKYDKAERMRKGALAMRETLYPETPILATTLNDLGEIYLAQGKYSEAEPVLKRALVIREKMDGQNDPDVAQTLQNLASVYLSRGNDYEAERLYRRALPIREECCEAFPPGMSRDCCEMTGAILDSLASLCVSHNRYAEAESLYKRVLFIREKYVGSEHPDVARSLSSLAAIYYKQAKYDDAEPLLRRALAIQEHASYPSGDDSLQVGTTLVLLMVMYSTQGRLTELEPFLDRAIRIYAKALLPERPHHPDMAITLDVLAGLCKQTNKYASAEFFWKQALQIREATFSPEQPEVVSLLNKLASLYFSLSKYAAAEPLYERALAIREKTLPPEHRDVLESLYNLAPVYHVQHKYAEAESLYKRILAINEKILKPEDPKVVQSLLILAELYNDQGRYAEVEPLYLRAIAIQEKTLHPEDPILAIRLNNLAQLYKNQGKYAMAESLYQRALTINEKALGLGHPQEATILENLKQLYIKQGKYSEWQIQENACPAPLSYFYFVDRFNGWASGITGETFHSSDRGKSWSKQKLEFIDPTGSGGRFCFHDTLTGWAVGTSGLAFRTNNGGKTWEEVNLQVHRNLMTIHFFDQKVGIIACGGTSGFPQDSGHSSILRTTDDGATWNWQSHPASDMIIAADFVQDCGWLMDLQGQLLCSTDKGSKWISRGLLPFFTLGIDFIDRNHGWLVGDDKRSGKSIVIKTDDGGRSWKVSLVSDQNRLACISFSDTIHGWVGGENGTIMQTKDGGKNWVKQNSNCSETIMALHVFNASEAISSCGGTVMLYSTAQTDKAAKPHR